MSNKRKMYHYRTATVCKLDGRRVIVENLPQKGDERPGGSIGMSFKRVLTGDKMSIPSSEEISKFIGSGSLGIKTVNIVISREAAEALYYCLGRNLQMTDAVL